MTIRVFVQNERGSTLKHLHDEKTLALRGTRTVAHPYPFPYGFVIGTDAADGLGVDCYVITSRTLRTGQVVECEPIGLLEQIEDGTPDHNVLAGLVDEPAHVTPEVVASLTEHILECFRDVPGKRMIVGRCLDAQHAHIHIATHLVPRTT
jgi:inorganic pyrophosphatase